MKNRSNWLLASVSLLLVLFIAISMLSDRFLRGARFDLTENHLYTLSQGSLNILDSLQEPITLYLFFSQETSRDLPLVRTYAQRVDELVEEFVSHSDGMLILKRIDPAPFSEQEDQAAAFGLQAVPVGAAGETLYLGLAGSNKLDTVQAMPFLQPSKEMFLEYDLAKMISSLGNPEKKKLGLMTSLAMGPGFDPATQSASDGWVIYDQLGQLFEIQDLSTDADGLPADLDVLMLVHPKNLGVDMLSHVEQFVEGGGNLILYLDPYAESDRGNPNDPMAQMQAGSASSLGGLLEKWGVNYDPTRVIGDLQYGAGTSQARHIGIVSVPQDGLNDEDIVTGGLELVNFSSSGWFTPIEGSDTLFEPLVLSSENAAPMDSSRLRFLNNPAELMTGFNPTGDRYALAARLSRPATGGKQGINILMFADTDLMTDWMWVQKQPFFGEDVLSDFADNGSLVVNAVDNMMGNKDLISIRTRASSGRPFDRVDEIRVAAEQSYRATEERLTMELEETERKLTELQVAKGESELTVISEEQQQEIQRFIDRKLEIRKELRQVQHDLQRDINSLGTRLKLINIGLIPALVMIAALFYGARRRRRQNRSHLKEDRV